MKKLNVKLNDIIRAQLVTVNGQVQTADLRVAGIQKEEGSSVFQDDAIYMKVQDLKKILGYREHETRLLLIAIQDTSRLREDREKLAAIFDPSPAVIPGQMIVRQKNVPASVLSYFTNADSLAIFTNGLSFASGNLPGPEKETGDGPAWIVLSLPLASAMGIRTGDSAVFYYKNKYGSVNTTNQYRVAGIFLTNRYTGVNTAYVSENVLYRNYFENIPDDSAAGYIPGPENLIYPSLTTEWQMFPPYHDDTEKDKIVNRLNTTSWKGSLLRISTMNEEGAHLLQYAVLMKMVTIVGILVLFLISQIGVMNTLRMSIRERTREIGTMRSIGFQKSQVRNMFVWETLFLTLFAAVVGIVLSFTLMGILSLVPIHTNNEVLTIFLLNERLYFLTDIGAVFLYLVTLAAAAALTAYFPARKASNMTAAEALCQRE
jgi:ABC-type lipoprotein release transport system permease subunit